MTDAKKALEAMTAALDALSPLEPNERKRAMTWLGETLEVSLTPDPAAQSGTGAKNEAGGDDRDDALPPKRFLAAKRPETDVERIACLAYYLTNRRDTPQFKTSDLTALNTEAAGQRFSNAARTANNALNQNGYLAQAGKGQRQISALGEQVVEALPDRDAVAAAIASAPKRQRRSRPKRKASSS